MNEETAPRIQIPGYALGSRIGRGGFSVVFEGEHLRLQRPVAIKVLMADLSDEQDVRHFERECQVLGRLGTHQAVVDVYDAGVSMEGRPYIVMKLYRRGTLADQLADSGPLSVEDAATVAARIGGAIEAANRIGVIHRDIKPANILIDDDGLPVIGDFGVAALAGVSGRGTTSIVFSRDHVAPEILDGNEYGVPSDVYALSSTLYTLLTGRAPFQADSDARLILAILKGDLAPMDVPGVPAGVEAVIRKGMATDPGDRYGSIEELVDEVSAAAAAAGIVASPRLAIGGPDTVILPSTGPIARSASESRSGVSGAGAAPVPVPGPPQIPPGPPPAHRGRVLAALLAVLVAVVVLLGAGTVYAITKPRHGSPAAAATSVGTPSGTSSSGRPVVPATAPRVPTSTHSCTGLTCTFTATDATAGTTYTWFFGDGDSATGRDVRHTYSTTTTRRFSGRLVASADGRSARSAFDLTINVWRAVVRLTAGQPGSYVLTAVVSGAPECRPVSYTLDWRAGSWVKDSRGHLTRRVQRISVSRTGEYRVVVARTIRAGGYCTGSVSRLVHVRPAPLPPVNTGPRIGTPA